MVEVTYQSEQGLLRARLFQPTDKVAERGRWTSLESLFQLVALALKGADAFQLHQHVEAMGLGHEGRVVGGVLAKQSRQRRGRGGIGLARGQPALGEVERRVIGGRLRFGRKVDEEVAVEGRQRRDLQEFGAAEPRHRQQIGVGPRDAVPPQARCDAT